MNQHAPALAALCASVLNLGGCAVTPSTPMLARHADVPTIQAIRLPAEATIVLDGRLDEPAWEHAPSYALALADSDRAQGKSVLENGEARLLWDDVNLYVGVTLIDSDVVQENDADQQHHYRTGDLIEVFLKPDIGTLPDGTPVNHYWELFGTPNNRKTAIFYPGRGRLALPSNLDAYTTRLGVAARVEGTLNDWRGRDEGWSAEMVIPLAELAAAGVPLDPHTPWRVLVSRYNYSAYLPDAELSMHPPLPEPRFHLHEHWARLQLLER